MTTIGNGTLAFYQRSTAQMSAIRREAEKLQSQNSTGERIERSSDDPVSASRLRHLARADRLAEIDAGNAARAKDGLSLASAAMGSIAQDIIRIRELALWAASDTISDNERASIGAEIAQIRLGILASANARDTSGNALFGGEAGGAAYTLDDAGNATYAGTEGSGELALGDGQSVTRGLTGPQFLSFTTGGQDTDLLAYLKTLSDALQGTVDGDPSKAASNALGGLDDALDTLTRSQTIVGARLAWIETIQERQVVTSQSRAAETADVGGVDLASNIAELQQMLTVLEASQAGFARLSGLTLFQSI